MEHEVVLEVAVVAEEASSREGLRPLVLPARDGDLTVKPVGPEKTARLGMQLHKTDHLSKWWVYRGNHRLDASRLFMILSLPSRCFLQAFSIVLCFSSSNCGVMCAFSLLCSPRDTVQCSPDNACAFLWIHPSYRSSLLCADLRRIMHQLIIDEVFQHSLERIWIPYVHRVVSIVEGTQWQVVPKKSLPISSA